MKKYFAVVLLLVLSGCITPQTPLVNAPTGGKIGVLVTAADNPLQYHVGTTIFNNEYIELDADWDIDSFSYEVVRQQLATLPNFEVVAITPDEKMKETGEANYEDGGVAALDKIVKDNDLVLLIAVMPYTGEVDYDTGLYARGYGVFTRCFFGICRARALTHLAAVLYNTNSLEDLTPWKRANNWGTAKDKKVRLDMEFPDGVKNIPLTELDKPKAELLKYLEAEIVSVLKNAGLISGVMVGEEQ